MTIELHTNYTVQQLLAMRDKIPSVAARLPRTIVAAKPKVRRFNDFDAAHRQVYRAIHEAVSLANPGERFELFAFGSRVKGDWRTDEEADGITPAGVQVKYSDWDVVSTAPNRPTDEHLAAVGLSDLRLDFTMSPTATASSGHIKVTPGLIQRVRGLWQRFMPNPRPPSP